MMDEALTIQKVENSDNFKYLFEFAKKKDYLKKINKYSVSRLTINKLKNLIISSIEQNNNNTNIISKPYRIIIDPTNACNLGCPLCPTGLGASERKKGILKLEDFKNVVDQVKDYCIEIHLYNWGEPTLNKHLVDMLSYATSRNLWSRISTNLSLEYKENFLEDLVRSGLSLLHVDLDGLDQEVYEKYRRKGNLKTVIKNLKKIKELKEKFNLKEPKLEIAMLAMKQNEHQHEDFFKFTKQLNADDAKIDKIQYNPNMDKEWLPNNQNLIYQTYEGGKANSLSATDQESKQCHWPWSGMVINWDGGINPCCIIDDPKSDFGNVKTNSIEQIWNSPEYVSSRSEFGDQKEITKKTICNICKNQTHSKRLSRVSKSFAIKL